MLIPTIAFLWSAAPAIPGVMRFILWTLTAVLAVGATVYIVLFALFAILEYAMLPPPPSKGEAPIYAVTKRKLSSKRTK